MLFSFIKVLTGLTDTVLTVVEKTVLTLLVVETTVSVVVLGVTVAGTVAFTGCNPEPEGGRLATIIAVLGVT